MSMVPRRRGRRSSVYASLALAGGVLALLLFFSRHSDVSGPQRFADVYESNSDVKMASQLASQSRADLLSKLRYPSFDGSQKEEGARRSLGVVSGESIDLVGEKEEEQQRKAKNRWLGEKIIVEKEGEGIEPNLIVNEFEREQKELEKENKIFYDWGEEEDGGEEGLKIIKRRNEEGGGEKTDDVYLISENEKNKILITDSEYSDLLVSRTKKVNSLHAVESERRIENPNTEPALNTYSENINTKTAELPKIETGKSTFRNIPVNNTTDAMRKLSNSYKIIFKQFLNMARIRIKQSFKDMKPDIDFEPGQVVPVNKARRILIVSTWRSGSSFLGEIFASYPGTFYTYEPLHFSFANHLVTSDQEVEKALQVLKDILTCNFNPSDDNIEYLRNNSYLLKYNVEMWNSCFSNKVLCFDPDFHNKVCQFCPVNVMKTVRIGVGPIAQILDDPTLDLRVIHLVRDPRGILNSRYNMSWCDLETCSNSKEVCEHYLDDLMYSEEYVKKYPRRFLRIRYEDLSLEPEAVTKKILKFAGLHYHYRVSKFLRKHTRLSDNAMVRKQQVGTFTTFRDSKNTPFMWRNYFTFDQMNNIQRYCNESMKSLGYTSFDTIQNYKNRSISALS